MERKLRENEKLLLKFLIEHADSRHHHLLALLEDLQIENFDDGGMDGFKIYSGSENDRFIGECIADAEFVDKDGVPVSIVLNLDKLGNLCELDIWKVDFSPLISWPEISEIKIN